MFASDKNACRDSQAAYFGDPCTYSFSHGATVGTLDIDAIFIEALSVVEVIDGQQVVSQRMCFEIRMSEISGVDKPRPDDTLTLDGVTYRIVEVHDIDDSLLQCFVHEVP